METLYIAGHLWWSSRSPVVALTKDQQDCFLQKEARVCVSNGFIIEDNKFKWCFSCGRWASGRGSRCANVNIVVEWKDMLAEGTMVWNDSENNVVKIIKVYLLIVAKWHNMSTYIWVDICSNGTDHVLGHGWLVIISDTLLVVLFYRNYKFNESSKGELIDIFISL